MEVIDCVECILQITLKLHDNLWMTTDRLKHCEFVFIKNFSPMNDSNSQHLCRCSRQINFIDYINIIKTQCTAELHKRKRKKCLLSPCIIMVSKILMRLVKRAIQTKKLITKQFRTKYLAKSNKFKQNWSRLKKNVDICLPI